MNADDKTRQGIDPAQIMRSPRRHLRPLAHRLLWRFAPVYARRRSARAEAATRLGRIEAEVERIGERHQEQIERLEDLARELIAAAESLRRGIADVEATASSAHRRIDRLATQPDAQDESQS
jgi:chromosome segregation ATPase